MNSVYEISIFFRIRGAYELIGLYELLEIPQYLEKGGRFSIGIHFGYSVFVRDTRGIVPQVWGLVPLGIVTFPPIPRYCR